MKMNHVFAPLALGLATAGAAAQTPATLPDINADDYFEGSTGGTFGKKVQTILPNSNRVAIGGFRVVYIVENAVSAQVRASYLPGRDTTAAHASMSVTLQGVDNATLQALTDKAYADFVAQLKAAGREVVPAEQMQALYGQLELAKTSPEAPYRKGDGRVGVAFSPTGMPLWWHNWDVGWGDAGFSQSNFKKFVSYSKDLDAFIIAPLIVVDFANRESSGNSSGLTSREASVGAKLAMSVPAVDTFIAHALEIKFGNLSKGDQANIHMTKRVKVDAEFATMTQIEEKKTTGFMAIMTGSSKSKSANTANTDNTRYSAAAGAALNQATGALAKFFQQHPAAAAAPAQ